MKTYEDQPEDSFWLMVAQRAQEKIDRARESRDIALATRRTQDAIAKVAP